MKTLEYYMGLPYRMEVVANMEEGGYVAYYSDLPGCISCGESIHQAADNLEEAKKEWLIAAIESGVEIAEPTRQISYSGEFRLRMPKSLHKTLAEQAKSEGISMNQYCIYLLSKNSTLQK